MSRKRAPGRGFGVGVTGHRRCFVRRADVQRRTRRRPHDPPGPFRSRAVSHPPAQSARPAARGTQRPGGAPDECREVALLSGARAPRHGAHARNLAAHLSDAGPGRCAAAAWNRGRLLEQPPRRRPAPRRARRRDERPARDALLRSGAPRIADAPAGERRHTRVPARDRRSALHHRMGERVSAGLSATRHVPLTARPSTDHRAHGERDTCRSRRYPPRATHARRGSRRYVVRSPQSQLHRAPSAR